MVYCDRENLNRLLRAVHDFIYSGLFFSCKPCARDVSCNKEDYQGDAEPDEGCSSAVETPSSLWFFPRDRPLPFRHSRLLSFDRLVSHMDAYSHLATITWIFSYNWSWSLARGLLRVLRYCTLSDLDPAQRNYLRAAYPPFANLTWFKVVYQLCCKSSSLPRFYSSRISISDSFCLVDRGLWQGHISPCFCVLILLADPSSLS